MPVPLTSAQLAENRKDIAAGKTPRNPAGPLNAPEGGTIDLSYGAPEQTAILSLRTRLNQLESILQDAGLLGEL